MPKSVARCSTNMSNSSNEPLSISSSMRSRAVSLPRLCCASMRACPPPSRALARRSSSFSRMSFIRSCARVPLPGLTHIVIARVKLGNPRTVAHPEEDAMAERHAGAVEGMPRLLLRIEGLALALGAALRLPPRRRELVAVRRADPGAGRELCRLSRQHAHRRDRLQRDARDARAADPRARSASCCRRSI